MSSYFFSGLEIVVVLNPFGPQIVPASAGGWPVTLAPVSLRYTHRCSGHILAFWREETLQGSRSQQALGQCLGSPCALRPHPRLS